MRIGSGPWTPDEMRAQLEEFASLYAERPVRDNEGGMRSPHMFLFWFVLRKLNPKVVIESGVWRGQGTWLIERACPDAEIICLDLSWRVLAYRSKGATYIQRDFLKTDWSRLPKERTLVFFDDHQNAVDRCKACVARGFTQVMFEDNYPPEVGDCYSLKKALAGAGHQGRPGLKPAIRRILGREAPKVRPNTSDADYLRSVLAVYEELPPTFKTKRTRWGNEWTVPTPEPLLQSVDAPYQQVFLDEAQSYTWLCYTRLK